MKEMTSKERVLAVCARQVPDRVPVSYDANAALDAGLRAHFGLAKDDPVGLMKALHCDLARVNPLYTGPQLHSSDTPGVQVDEWGVHTRWVEHGFGGYWDFCDFPLQHAEDEELATWALPDPDHYDYSGIAGFCQQNEEFCFITGGAGTADFMNSVGRLRGQEQIMVDMALREPGVLAFFDRMTDVEIGVLERTVDACKGAISVLWIGEDLGTQKGPLISVDMYREILRPRHQRYIDFGKAHGLPVMFHSCGSSSWAFNDLAEMGVSVVDTLQPEASKMEPRYLKQTYGDRLAFHGCFSTAGCVVDGTPDEVAAHCRELLEIMKPDGGYCFAPTHSLQDNTPVENVVRAYDEVFQSGNY